MRLGIRCDGDAGQESGTGHVFRSLEYARLLRHRHPELEIRFFMRDFPEGLSMVREAGYSVEVLPLCPTEEEYCAVFTPFGMDLIILDTLGTDRAVMRAARQASRHVVTLDDLNPPSLHADAVINGILWATKSVAPGDRPVQVFQGARYLPLRTQFADAWKNRGKIRTDIREIVICTGGHDETKLAPQIFQSLSELPFACRVVFCAGPSHENTQELEALGVELSGDRVRLEVLRQVADMAGLMLQADLAVLTGGTLLFEAAACGLPSIIMCSQEHQVPQADYFARRGAAVSMGFVEVVDKQVLRKAVADMTESTRQRISLAARDVVDGRGILRVVDILSSYLEK